MSAPDPKRVRELETIAAWREDLTMRIEIAELCFQTIGLTEERRAALEHEVGAFKRVCERLAKNREQR